MPESDRSGSVRLRPGPRQARFLLRGRAECSRFRAACRQALDVALPPPSASCATDRAGVLWFGRDAWMILSEVDEGAALAARLHEALTGCVAALVEVTAAWQVVRIEGHGARHLLAKGCPLDLSPQSFPQGRCARSHLGPFSVLLHHPQAVPAFDVYVARSYGDAAWAWLEDAAGSGACHIPNDYTAGS